MKYGVDNYAKTEDNKKESRERYWELHDQIVEKRKFRYDFGVCNDSSNISGGEKQRIILARGLMNNFEVLILDEALSETDYEMEAKIIKNMLAICL